MMTKLYVNDEITLFDGIHQKLMRNSRNRQSWVRPQHPPTRWHLRGGRRSSVEYSTQKKRKKSKKTPIIVSVRNSGDTDLVPIPPGQATPVHKKHPLEKQSQQSWVRSQDPPTQWNLRGGRRSSVEYSTQKKKNPKNPSVISNHQKLRRN